MLHALAVYMHRLDPVIFYITDDWGPRWYGLSYAMGFLLTFWMIQSMSRKGLTLLKPVQSADLIIYLAAGTMIGGRLGHAIFYKPDELGFSSVFPYWNLLALHRGGMASHGGMIGITIACWLYARRIQVPMGHICDLASIGGTAGVFFGRIANFINGELVGRPCSPDLPWAVQFPQDMFTWLGKGDEATLSKHAQNLSNLWPAVHQAQPLLDEQAYRLHLARMTTDGESARLIEQAVQHVYLAVQKGNAQVIEALAPVLETRHPSQIYAALVEGLLMFCILMFIWRRPRRPGVIAGGLLVGYPIVRIFNEFFRMPDEHLGFRMLGLTRGQWLSVWVFIFGAWLLWYWASRPVPRIGGWAGKPRSETPAPPA